MELGPEQTRYEPLPRWGHVSVVIGNKLYLWGGRIEDFSEESKKELASVVEVFDFEAELWEKKTTSGTPPPGLYNTAYTTIDHCLYVYGGWDGHLAYNSLHKLDVLTLTWTELKPTENSEIPMKMSGCGLVSYGKNKLVLFGGCGVPTEDSQPSSTTVSRSGTVSYTTVKSPEGSGAGASQEEEARMLEVSSGLEVHTQAEVHSQPDSIPPLLSEGVMGLYDLAVSQLNSQVSNQSLSQAASQQEDSTQPPGPKTKSQDNSSVEPQSEEVGDLEETKAQPPSPKKGESDSQSQKEEPRTQSQEKEGNQEQSPSKEKEGDQAQSQKKEDQSHSQEKGGDQSQSQEITVLQENGEVKVHPQSQENGVPETESQDEKKLESQSHSQDSEAAKTDSQEKAVAATIPQSLQNGEITVLPPTAKEADTKRQSEGEIQAQSQLQSQPAEEDSEEESDDGSDVMDKRWTNELKIFDIQESAWTTPTVQGELPPPCVDFSFTCVDDYRSLMYGGFQPESGTSSEAYVLNMETWSWTKLRTDDITEGVAWPVGRDGHASCLLAGAPNPQVLISGGWDKDNKLINDAWILNINERMWKELTMPVIVGARFWHSVSCYQFSRRMKQLLFFGGCPGAPEELISGGCWAKLAATVVVELGLMDPILPVISVSRLSMDVDLSSPSDWVVLDATDHAQLGLPNKRLKERVLLAEYRAIRAENIARDVLKKLETIDLRPISTPYQLTDGNRYDDSTPLPNEEEEEKTQKETRPFWEISEKDVQLTGVDIGKGRWSIVREATYRGDRVAARCLYSKIISEDNFKVFIECMDTAAKLRHTNLLPFIGAVLEGEPIIITELMPYNLKKVLEKKGQLLNYQIVGIALDVARALNFLHTAKPDPVVHGDLTSTSVLLEQGKGNSWRAKLSDFMTAKFFKQLLASGVEFDRDRRSMSPGSPLVTGVPKHSIGGPLTPSTSSRSSSTRERRSRSSSIGSEPDRHNRKMSMVTPPDILDPTNLTPKRDIYSYGLLLVEMCSGSTPQVISLPFLIESITWIEMNTLIRQCIELDPESRPSMEEILPKIAEMHQSLSIGQGPSRPAVKKTFV